MVVVMITSFITPFMVNAVNLVIPAIGIEFGASQSMLNWIVSSFLISTAAFLLPFGRLADQHGRKKIFLLGMMLLAVSSLGCALAPTLPALLGFRALQGIASAMVLSTSMAILASIIPPQSRGKALGFNSAATYFGLTCGPVLGGFISNAFTWRSVFYFNMLIAVVVAFLTVWKLKGEWKGEPSKIDSGGIVFCILAQVLLLFGLNNIMTGLLNRSSFAVGVLLLVTFFIYEKRHKNPLLHVEIIIKNKPFAYASLAALVNYSATFAITYLLSLFLQAALQLDAAVSGLILLICPVLMVLLSPVVGHVSDRMSPRIIASTGMAITTVSLFIFIFLTINSPIIYVILNVGLAGVGFALFITPNTSAILGSVDKTQYGIASSILGNMRLIGQSISIAIVSIITSIYIQDLQISSPGYVENLLVSIRTAFIVFSILGVMGVWFTARKRKQVDGSSV